MMVNLSICETLLGKSIGAYSEIDDSTLLNVQSIFTAYN